MSSDEMLLFIEHNPLKDSFETPIVRIFRRLLCPIEHNPLRNSFETVTQFQHQKRHGDFFSDYDEFSTVGVERQ